MESQALDQPLGRGGRPAIIDMPLAQVRQIDPGFCDRLQGLGIPEPLLCGAYLDRTVGELAQAEQIDLALLLEAVRLGPSTPAATPPKSEPHRASPGTRLAAEVAQINLAHELEELRAEPAWREFDRNAKTLVKNRDLRVVLLSFKAGARMDQHWAAGPISIQVLAGHVRVQLPEERLDLRAGDIAAMAPSVRHDLEAIEPSALLLTIACPSGKLVGGGY